MNTDTPPLSPRHERFVAEFLKDGNATQAYIRAGYSSRGAQPSASRLLRDARIEAAVAAGRQRIAQALEVDVTRLAQEYAKIAFANISDFVSVDKDRRLHIDLEKASLAQQAGILELKISNHSKPEQRQVTLKLGKLQALAALTKNIGVLVQKPKPGLTPEDRERYEDHRAGYERELDYRLREQRRLEQELREARAALDAANRKPSGLEAPPMTPIEREPDMAGAAAPPEKPCESGPPNPATSQSQPAVEPGMPTGSEPDFRPGLHPNAKFTFSGGREHRLGPDSADALKAMKPGGFPGR